jgi:hypothetical protein
MPLFGVEHSFKEQDTDGGEDDVITAELLDPGVDLDGIEIGGQDAGSGLDHGEDCREGYREEKEGEEEFAIAGAKAEGGEEGAVDDQGPGSKWENQEEEPEVAEGMEVEEDDEDRGQDRLDDQDEEHVGDGFA